MTDEPTRSPFDDLADTGDRYTPPDPAFTAALRRRVERELIEIRNDPVVTLPDRAPTTPQETTIMGTTVTATDNTTASNAGATIEPTDAAAAATQILTPYITVHDGAAALDWYRTAFGAEETIRYVGDDGRIGHAEFVVAGANVMLSDDYPEFGVVAANSHEGSSCSLHVEVADCDGMYRRAVDNGAESNRAPADQPHGARSATIVDPFGHRWMLSQQSTSPTAEEIGAAYGDFTVIEAESSTDSD